MLFYHFKLNVFKNDFIDKLYSLDMSLDVSYFNNNNNHATDTGHDGDGWGGLCGPRKLRAVPAVV